MPLKTQTVLMKDQDDAPLALVIQKVGACFDCAERFFGHKFVLATCNFKQKGRAAGTAHLQKNELRFNRFMYEQSPAEFLATVVPHEVAHLIVFQIYGDTVKPHGKEWQSVMVKVYGLEPSRTHTFEVPPQKNTFSYRCSCKEHLFSKQRHNRANKGVAYICKNCRSSLLFTGYTRSKS